jgi:hypothetical protein
VGLSYKTPREAIEGERSGAAPRSCAVPLFPRSTGWRFLHAHALHAIA